jgi:hypothetical protein
MHGLHFGLALALAHPPPARDDVEGTCHVHDAVVYARREPHVGLTWFMDRPGNPALELGWGYEGAAACAAGHRGGRYLVAWGFFDPYGGSPEIVTAVVEDDAVVARHDHRARCIDATPISVTPRGDGWLLRWRCGDSIEERSVDRDGR